jgi:hypothetical protein
MWVRRLHLFGYLNSMGIVDWIMGLFTRFSFWRSAIFCDAAAIHCTTSTTVEGSGPDTAAVQLLDFYTLAAATPDIPGRLRHIESVEVPRAIIESGRLNKLTATALGVYLAILAESSPHQNSVAISYDHFAGMLGRSKRMVIYAVGELIAEGLIDRQGSRTETPRYEALWVPKIPAELPPSHYRARTANCPTCDESLETAAIDCGVIGNPLHQPLPADPPSTCTPDVAPAPEPTPLVEAILTQPSVPQGRTNGYLVQQLLCQTVSESLIKDIETAVGSEQAVSGACQVLIRRGHLFGNEQELRSAVTSEARRQLG